MQYRVALHVKYKEEFHEKLGHAAFDVVTVVEAANIQEAEDKAVHKVGDKTNAIECISLIRIVLLTRNDWLSAYG